MRVPALLLAVMLLVGLTAADDAHGRGGDPTGLASPALREELLEMMRADQQERTGAGLPPGTKLPPSRDYARSVRLKQIISEFGWPTHRMVGRDGGTAAWLVAQHADFD